MRRACVLVRASARRERRGSCGHGSAINGNDVFRLEVADDLGNDPDANQEISPGSPVRMSAHLSGGRFCFQVSASLRKSVLAIRPREAGEVNQAWPLDEAWQIRFLVRMTSIIVALTCAAVPSLAIWGFVALLPVDRCP